MTLDFFLSWQVDNVCMSIAPKKAVDDKTVENNPTVHQLVLFHFKCSGSGRRGQNIYGKQIVIREIKKGL